jgi:xanthine dehydrogenase large subunit
VFSFCSNWPLACAVSVAAKALKKPVRAQQSRNNDLIMSGKRHEHQYDFTCAFGNDGTITAIIITITSNAGWVRACRFALCV